MMDLTPLEIRKKKGDFSRGLRGYDPQEVDQFLDLVAERLEEVVKLNLTLEERVERLGERVRGQESREQAVHEALVTAQSLKQEIQEQAKREADLVLREAKALAEGARESVEQTLDGRAHELAELSRSRKRFLQGFRDLLERGLEVLESAESNPPSDEFDLDVLQFGRPGGTHAQPGAPPPKGTTQSRRDRKTARAERP
jgi:cell division initiation protein